MPTLNPQEILHLLRESDFLTEELADRDAILVKWSQGRHSFDIRVVVIQDEDEEVGAEILFMADKVATIRPTDANAAVIYHDLLELRRATIHCMLYFDPEHAEVQCNAIEDAPADMGNELSNRESVQTMVQCFASGVMRVRDCIRLAQLSGKTLHQRTRERRDREIDELFDRCVVEHDGKLAGKDETTTTRTTNSTKKPAA
jgi:hypothetical protein